jgi:hypothetical protein
LVPGEFFCKFDHDKVKFTGISLDAAAAAKDFRLWREVGAAE